MAWNIASIPFWLLGAFWFFALFFALPLRQPGETTITIAKQMLASFIAWSISWIIAAWLVS